MFPELWTTIMWVILKVYFLIMCQEEAQPIRGGQDEVGRGGNHEGKQYGKKTYHKHDKKQNKKKWWTTQEIQQICLDIRGDIHISLMFLVKIWWQIWGRVKPSLTARWTKHRQLSGAISMTVRIMMGEKPVCIK